MCWSTRTTARSPSRRQAADNLSLSIVEFYVDGKRVGSVEAAPFSFTWSAVRGEHALRVLARDRAGNESEAEIQFGVE